MTGASRRLTPIVRLHKLDHLKHSRLLWHENVKNRKEVQKFSKPTLFYDILLYLYLNPRIDPRLTKVPWVVPRWHPSSIMNKTEMIWKTILSLFHFMTKKYFKPSLFYDILPYLHHNSCNSRIGVHTVTKY
jgi:hypothetical protein